MASPFALSLLGVESLGRRRREQEGGEEPVQDATRARAARASRRATSYYNTFQTVCSPCTDDPPAYAVAARQRPLARRYLDGGHEILPKYTSTVNAEAKMLVQVESISPLHMVTEGEWKEMYITLRGTMLSFHRVKDGGPGKLVRSYTLQHAEVGLATDSDHTVLVPQTRLAHLIPTMSRQKAYSKDPDLFKPIRQFLMRLRVETDQIVMADASEERVTELVLAISAAIDMSPPIDDRSQSRQTTVPRRRRRQRTRIDDLTDPALLAEQERIMRNMYPALAERSASARPQLERVTTAEEVTAATAQTASREEDDLDMAAIREDFAAPSANPAPSSSSGDDDSSRPVATRQTTTSTIQSTFSTSMMYTTASTNFDTEGKWRPPHTRTAAQIQRYTRRCMPVLHAEAVRASDIIISNGKRMKINWRMDTIEEWELSPPSYKAHRFPSVERSSSQRSYSASGNGTSPQSSRSLIDEGGDQIAPVEGGVGGLELSKVVTMDKGIAAPRPQSEVKVPETRHVGTEIHGVVFCF